MMCKALVLVALLLAGCNSMVKSSVPSPTPASSAEPLPMKTPRNNSVPRELKLKLTLDAPGDLKVKQGDRVSKGQVISDRTSTRKQLEQQRQTIRLKLEHLNASARAGSSPVSYAVEQAKVRQAQVRVQQARKAIAHFKVNSPWTGYAWAKLPLYKELVQVLQLDAKAQDAEAELGLAVAQLQAARENKPASEDTSLQQVLLLSQMREIEEKLDRVGVVRSPYDGKVKKIKWIGQTDQESQVDLILATQV